MKGSPARAGMHRSLISDSSRPTRFPRARGDAPVREHSAQRGERVPPRARGCTEHHQRRPHSFGGSPARAGMHPASIVSVLSSFGFPRARGDAPVRTRSPKKPIWVPPRARGCTVAVEVDVVVVVGSPARGDARFGWLS